MVKVKIKRLSPEAVMPSKGTDKSAGYDLTAISASWDKERNQVKYHFGLAFEIPEGYVGLIFPRSSVCKRTCLCQTVWESSIQTIAVR